MNQKNVFMVLTEECNQNCRLCYNAGTLAATGKKPMGREDYEHALGWVKEHFSLPVTKSLTMSMTRTASAIAR